MDKYIGKRCRISGDLQNGSYYKRGRCKKNNSYY